MRHFLCFYCQIIFDCTYCRLYILSDWRWSWETEMAQEIDWKENNNNRRRRIIIATGELDFRKGTDPLLALYGALFSFWISGLFSFPGGRFHRWRDCQFLGKFLHRECAKFREAEAISVLQQALSSLYVLVSFGISFPQGTLVFIVKKPHGLVYVWAFCSPLFFSSFFLYVLILCFRALNFA